MNAELVKQELPEIKELKKLGFFDEDKAAKTIQKIIHGQGSLRASAFNNFLKEVKEYCSKNHENFGMEHIFIFILKNEKLESDEIISIFIEDIKKQSLEKVLLMLFEAYFQKKTSRGDAYLRCLQEQKENVIDIYNKLKQRQWDYDTHCLYEGT